MPRKKRTTRATEIKRRKRTISLIIIFFIRSERAKSGLAGCYSAMVAGGKRADCNFASIALVELYCCKVFGNKQLDSVLAQIVVAGT